MIQEQEVTAPIETEIILAGWAAKSSARPRSYAHIVFAAKTDLGQIRENNEDKFDCIEPDEPSVLAVKGRIYAVADGMGGHSAGQVAAELALNLFIRSYYSDLSGDIERCLRKSVREANAYVVDVARNVPGRTGMGATLTAGVVRDDDLFLVQVGDSRCYLLRDGRLEQMTEDHSWVAEQVRSGAMKLEDAEQSPFRNVITRSMGGAPEVEPDITAVKLQPGDRYLLCSDGLSGMVPHAEIEELLAQGSPSVAAWNLIERANQYGGRDNITAFVLQVADIQPWPEEEGAGEEQPSANGRQPAIPSGPEPPRSVPMPDDPVPAGVGADESPARGGLVRRLLGRT